MFKAGNLLGAHKRCIYWVAKENGIKPTKQTLKKKKKQICQGLAAHLVCVHSFSPMVVNSVSFPS